MIKCSGLQRENFGLYALYSKNKPQSDALIQQHTFFKVRNVKKKFKDSEYHIVL